MKKERNILVAFLLNIFLSVFEVVGGIMTGSIAIASDAVHDFADAVSIGISWALERKSRGAPDDRCTYGYGRYSLLGGVITALVLVFGAIAVIINSGYRLFDPKPIDYNGMILFACVGVIVNFAAVLCTHRKENLNERVVNLHMLEDMLGWIVVLIGAAVMRFADLSVLDPILSIGISLFILIHALRELKTAADVFLEKVPVGMDLPVIQKKIAETDGVLDMDHLHVWSLDGVTNCATMHITTREDPADIKEKLRSMLNREGIEHVVIETGKPGEKPVCNMGSHRHHCHHG